MRPGAAFATSVAAAVLIATAAPAAAGAWVQPKGKGQVIVKYEDMWAGEGFDPAGTRLDLSKERRDRSAGVFAEYGLTDRLTLQLKGDWQNGEDAFVDYEGRGPLELGVTWQAWRDERGAISLYGGHASAGDARNAGYASPGVGDSDWEVRVSAGRSFAGAPGRRAGGLTPDRSFVEIQAARRMRTGLPDEIRADFTFGGRFGDHWMVLAQAYGGMVDGGGARWLSVETSIVRDVGDWSLQAGWRETVAGRETAVARGPVVALWRRF